MSAPTKEERAAAIEAAEILMGIIDDLQAHIDRHVERVGQSMFPELHTTLWITEMHVKLPKVLRIPSWLGVIMHHCCVYGVPTNVAGPEGGSRLRVDCRVRIDSCQLLGAHAFPAYQVLPTTSDPGESLALLPEESQIP